MKSKYLLPVLSVICLLAVSGMIISLIAGNKANTTDDFLRPPFESAAQSGMPDTDDESWSKIYQDGMSFAAYACGRVSVTDDIADVYFTSVAENEVWVKLRVLDKGGTIIGETGLLKPGQYVKSVRLDAVPENGTEIQLKIMAYEPETYYSAGAVNLTAIIRADSENPYAYTE